MAYRQCVKLFKWRHWNCSALQPQGATDSPFREALKGTFSSMIRYSFYMSVSEILKLESYFNPK